MWVIRVLGYLENTGLKGAFMGYIGLLLNAPYKIDSMVWMSLMMLVSITIGGVTDNLIGL
jgi:hypothetical protein